MRTRRWCGRPACSAGADLVEHVGLPGIRTADLGHAVARHHQRPAPARPDNGPVDPGGRHCLEEIVVVVGAEQQARLGAAAQIPVDQPMERPLGLERRLRSVPERLAVVGVELDLRSPLARAPGEIEHQLAAAGRQRERDAGQVNEIDSLERLFGHIGRAEPRRGGARAVVDDRAASAGADLEEEPGGRLRIRNRPTQVDPFGLQGGAHGGAQLVLGQPR
jgi:hypothetical protein